MTISGFIVFILLTLCIIAVAYVIGCLIDTKAGMIISTIIGLVICIAMWGLGFWYYNNTESGKRAFKTQESNLSGGIERKVTVYDVEGDAIAEYQGKFDVEYDNDRILFDDENGCRHIIYYPTGNVIIDEVSK